MQTVPSPSQLPLLSRCRASFRECAKLPNISSEASIEGRANHRAAEYAAKDVNIDPLKLATEFGISEDLAEQAIGRQWYMRKLKTSGWIVGTETEMAVTLNDKLSIFGTCDLTAFDQDCNNAIVADQKSGRLEVDPPSVNLQLIAYAIGVLQCYPGIQKMKLSIIYSRFGQAVECEWTPAELLAWLPTIERIVADAMGPRADYNPGQHCQYCRACATCPAIQKSVALITNGELALVDLKDAAPAIKTKVLTMMQVARKWADSAEAALKSPGVAPFAVEDGKEWGPIESPRKSLIPSRESFESLFALVGEHYVDAVSITNQPIEKALRDGAGKGLKKKAVDDFWEAMRSKGFVKERTITQYRTHTVGEREDEE